MEEEAEVEAVDIDHDGLLLADVAALPAVELQVPILVEPVVLAAHGDVVEDIDLRGYFALMRDELYLFDADHPVELQGHFLRVRAEALGLPPLRPSEQ